MSTFQEELIRDYGRVIIQSTQTFDSAEYDRCVKRFTTLFKSFLPANQSARIADIGCGDGHFLYFLKKLGYSQIEGVDASEDRLNLCRQYVTPHVFADDVIHWLKERPNTFDMLSCHHVIEHFPEEALVDFVRALKQALKPEGFLLLTTPNACTPWSGYNHYHDLTHRRLFTTDSLTQLFAWQNMSTACFPEGATPYDAWSTLRWMAWKCREAWLKLCYRIDMGGTRGNQKTPLIVSNNLIAVVRRAS